MSKGVHNIAFLVTPDLECSRTTHVTPDKSYAEHYAQTSVYL